MHDNLCGRKQTSDYLEMGIGKVWDGGITKGHTKFLEVTDTLFALM